MLAGVSEYEPHERPVMVECMTPYAILKQRIEESSRIVACVLGNRPVLQVFSQAGLPQAGIAHACAVGAIPFPLHPRAENIAPELAHCYFLRGWSICGRIQFALCFLTDLTRFVLKLLARVSFRRQSNESRYLLVYLRPILLNIYIEAVM